MATRTWIATGLGSWTTAANWSSGQVPGPDDTALFTLPGDDLIDLPGAITVSAVVLSDAGAALDVIGSLAVTNGLTITAGTVDVTGTLDATNLSNAGSIDNTGVLILDGTIPGSSLRQIGGIAGTLAVDGIVENAGGTLDGNSLSRQNFVGSGTILGGTVVNLGGDIAATLDGVTVQGSLQLGGYRDILNDLMLVGADGTGPGTLDLLTGSTLEFVDDQSLDNAIVSGDGRIIADDTLTIGSDVSMTEANSVYFGQFGITLDGTGAILNHGTIAGMSTNGEVIETDKDALIVVGSADFENFGVLDAYDSSAPVSNTPNQIDLNAEGNAQIEINAARFVNQVGAITETGQSAGLGEIAISATTDFTNDGLLSTWNGVAASGGAIDVAAPVLGSGTIEIANGGEVTLESGVSSTQTIAFVDNGTLTLDRAGFVSAAIAGFNTGDVILLNGVSAAAVSYGDGDLKLRAAGGGTLDLAIGGAHTLSDFVVSTAASGTEVQLTSTTPVPCFAAGSRIATRCGSVEVERLRVGDRVLTLSGQTQAVQWIGHRKVDCRRHPDPERVWPIRIAPHAFGEGRPKRALWLSPDHSVYADEVLIPVKFLVNGSTIEQLTVDVVIYYHVELSRHDILMAYGLPVESYLETGGRTAFSNAGGVAQLHPDFQPDQDRVAMVWQTFACAPLLGNDGQLDRVRAKLRCQAEMLRGRSGEPRRRARTAA